jgi:hypothetical protein
MVSSGFLKKLSSTINTNYVAPTGPALVYNSFQTIDSYHMFTLASATWSNGAPSSLEVTPASVLVFEVYADNTVKAFFNDIQFTPIGCSTPCLA